MTGPMLRMTRSSQTGRVPDSRLECSISIGVDENGLARTSRDSMPLRNQHGTTVTPSCAQVLSPVFSPHLTLSHEWFSSQSQKKHHEQLCDSDISAGLIFVDERGGEEVKRQSRRGIYIRVLHIGEDGSTAP